MLYDVSVSRISTATRDIRVEAASAEEAQAKALERACDEDFGGCITDYNFEVNGAVRVDGEEEDDGDKEEDEEPSPDFASEEKRCPDLGDGTCALCPTPFPGVSDETIDAGWVPSYFIGEEEQSGPVCPRCAEQFIVYDPKDGEATLVVDGEYVSVWDGGVEVRTKCVCGTHTREIHIEASQDVNVEVLDREYVLLNGKEYKACNEEEWATYTAEQQSRMFFWK